MVIQLSQYVLSRSLYFWTFAILIGSLALSPFMTSIGVILLCVNWIFQGIKTKNYHSCIQKLIQRKSLWVFLCLYAVHLIGLLYTSDFAYGLKDIKIKLPLLLVPLVLGTSRPFSKNELKELIALFSLSILAGTIVCLAVLFLKTPEQYGEIRNISIIISHIRFSLMINMAIVGLGYIVLSGKFDISKIEKILYSITGSWFIVFLFILQSLTGLMVLGAIFIFITLRYFFLAKKRKVKIALISVIFIGILSSVLFVAYVAYNFYDIKETDFTKLEKRTKNGRLYEHDTSYKLLENGHYIGLYYNEYELKKEWEKRSSIPYAEKDKKDQNVKFTLIRYLTSKGLRKDSVGIWALSKADIKQIENGIANYVLSNQNLYSRIYEIIWEIDVYFKKQDNNGHSVTQRCEYFKIGTQIFIENLWIGIGTGDVKQSFKKKYNENNSHLDKKFQRRAHNQILTFLLTFGILGTISIMYSFVYPIFYEKQQKNLLLLCFVLIFLISLVNEDTLETQAGATFVACFYSLLVFGSEKLGNGTTQSTPSH